MSASDEVYSQIDDTWLAVDLHIEAHPKTRIEFPEWDPRTLQTTGLTAAEHIPGMIATWRVAIISNLGRWILPLSVVID